MKFVLNQKTKTETIDAVIPYVDCSDPIWLDSYNKYVGQFKNDFNNGISRYRDTGTLELVLKSIRKFAPFFNNVYLVVSSLSQVPDYVKDYDVKIIQHSDFIPKEYLPLFSSNALETWLHRLPVSENFVWFNDDTVIIKPITIYDFFSKNNFNHLIPNNYIGIKPVSFHVDNLRLNAFNLIFNTNQNKLEYHTQHGPEPYKLSWCKEYFEKYKDKLLANYHPLGREMSDYNQYACVAFQAFMKTGKINQKQYVITQSFGSKRKYDLLTNDYLLNTDKKIICLNDSAILDIEPYVKIVNDYIENYK